MGQCVLPVSKPYITHTPVIANKSNGVGAVE